MPVSDYEKNFGFIMRQARAPFYAEQIVHSTNS